MRERGVAQLGPYHPDEGDRVEADEGRDEEVPDEHHLDRHAEHSQRGQGRDAEVDKLLQRCRSFHSTRLKEVNSAHLLKRQRPETCHELHDVRDYGDERKRSQRQQEDHHEGVSEDAAPHRSLARRVQCLSLQSRVR